MYVIAMYVGMELTSGLGKVYQETVGLLSLCIQYSLGFQSS